MTKVILPITLFILLILTIVFALVDQYWYYSILTFSLALIITIVCWMWQISGWATDLLNKLNDKDESKDKNIK